MAEANCSSRAKYEDATIRRALRILEGRLREPGTVICNPAVLRDYLALNIGDREHEIFMVVFLDRQNRVINAEELFRGTLAQTSVYPREVVKRALALNAAGVIFAHNHPSGVAEPSSADQWLTHQLKAALALVDVDVVDHLIIAGSQALSFAECGYLGIPTSAGPTPKRGRPRKADKQGMAT